MKLSFLGTKKNIKLASDPIISQQDLVRNESLPDYFEVSLEILKISVELMLALSDLNYIYA